MIFEPKNRQSLLYTVTSASRPPPEDPNTGFLPHKRPNNIQTASTQAILARTNLLRPVPYPLYEHINTKITNFFIIAHLFIAFSSTCSNTKIDISQLLGGFNTRLTFSKGSPSLKKSKKSTRA